MINRKISFGVVAGGVSLALSSLSGIIIYPLLLGTLSKEIAGLWFFYSSLTIIINLGQASLSPIVMKRSAAISKEGESKISEFISLIKISYLIISIIVLIICFVLYFSYVRFVISGQIQLFNDGLISWILFVSGNLITIYFSKNFSIINGFGEVGWDKLIQILNTLLLILGYFIVLKIGYGLIGLSMVYLLSCLIFAISSEIVLKKIITLNLNQKHLIKKQQIVDIFKEGGSILILNLVSIVVMNKDIFLVERFLGLSNLPSYSALIRIQGIVIAVSILIPQILFPFISQSFALGNFEKVKKLYWQGVIFSVIVGLFMSVLLMAFAGTIFPIWLGKGNYLGNNILFLLLALALIYIHHNSHASAVISTSKNSFVWVAIINGLLSIPLAFLGIKYFGIEGMIIGNIIATIFPSMYVVHYSVNYFAKLTK